MPLYIFIFLFGLLAGFVIHYIYSNRKKAKDQNDFDINNFIPKNYYEEIQKQKQLLENELVNKSQILGNKESEIHFLKENQTQSKIEFKNIANEILTQESERFLKLNKENLDGVLNPLKDRISDFQKKVELVYDNEAQQRSALKKELEIMIQESKRMSEETHQLTQALKGDKKLQGNWGEIQLESLLDRSGLVKNVHYFKQVSLENKEGNTFRPDFIIHLPDNKQVVIDSKVSLVNYEKYYNSEIEEEKSIFLKDHLKAIENHIDDLSSKNYSDLENLNSLDYVIMFIPLEPAFLLAIQEKLSLFESAFSKKIILSSSMNLFPILKTIAFLWKQDSQSKNARQIADKAGQLHDKLARFFDDLIEVGKNLDKAKDKYTDSMKKLTESTHKKDTILARTLELKEMGANTKNEISESLKKRIEE